MKKLWEDHKGKLRKGNRMVLKERGSWDQLKVRVGEGLGSRHLCVRGKCACAAYLRECKCACMCESGWI